MSDVVVFSIRPPLLNAKGDQLVLWHRLDALIKAKINIHLVLYVGEKDRICDVIKKSEFVKITYLNHGIFDTFKSILSTIFTLYPLESRLFANKKLEKITKTLNKSENTIVLFFSTRIWASVKQYKNKLLYAELIDSYALNYKRRPARGIFKIFYNIQSNLHGKLESEVVNNVKKAFVVSKVDSESMSNKKIYTIPNGVNDCTVLKYINKIEYSIGFLGNLNYGPNKRAVKWFAEEIMPLIQKKNKNARFIVAGNNSNKLNIEKTENIEIIGRVDSQFEFFAGVCVAVAPMLDGAGMQNKVLEAMSAGTPVVLTSIASKPITDLTDSILFVADTKEEIAEKILLLFNDKILSNKIGENGRNFIIENYSWSCINSLFLEQIGLKDKI